MIHGYTREAGVRNLERQVATACRRVARKRVEKGSRKVVISTRTLSRYLGPPAYKGERAERVSSPGVAIGLAWTPFGGDVLFIEATKMAGGRHLTLTGSLGEVMRESAQAALSYVRSNAEKLGINPDFYEKYDIHVHVPAGAIPKDGPSAGATLTIALISLLTGRRVDPELGMTGEISLQGKVLPVGGIKEKVIAASRFGLKRVLLPRLNETSVQEIPEEVRELVDITLISDIHQAVQHALLPAGERRRKSR
jgi:ATP-dependent Lon protease